MTSSIVIPGYNPANRVPGFFFALDNSRANTATATRRVLLIGQSIQKEKAQSSGFPQSVLATSISDAASAYGQGSQIVRMLQAYRAIDPQGEAWILAVPDASGAQAATGTIKIQGTASNAGTLPIYIGDSVVPVGVSLNDTASVIANNLLAAIGQNKNLPVSASVDAASQDGSVTVHFTALNSGLCGNDIALNVALLGTANGESIPNGIEITISKMSGGTQNPILDNVLIGAGSRTYDLIGQPWTDETSLSAFEQWLNNISGRWMPQKQLYGQVITAVAGTFGQVLALPIKNDPHMSIMPISDSPTDPIKWIGYLVAQASVSMKENPALPIKDLVIPALPPSSLGVFDDLTEKNQLLYSGLSTFKVGDDGSVLIERIITNYTKNADGSPDNSYLDIERLLTAQVCLQDLRDYLSSLFSRVILLQNGSKIPVGVPATTPDIIKSYIVARYSYQCDQCWAQNLEDFEDGLVVEYAGEGVVRTELPYQFADQLWVIAGNCQFIAAS
ncbi:phage tail protein [Acetobacteraceae bacterium]|nr:phage tail protein [Acetobacteraceae bacterium]